MNTKRGQTLPYFLLMMMVLVMSWAMVVNIAKLVRDRIMMQNAADNAALSASVYRARTLNLLGEANYLMAAALAAGAFPCMVPVPLFDITHVGGSAGNIPFPFCDVKCNGGFEYSVEYGGVNRLRFTVNTLARFQKALVLLYIPQTINIARGIGRRQEMNAGGETSGADEVLPVPGELASSIIGGLSGGGGQSSLSDALSGLAPEKVLGLERNRTQITYYKTVNLGITADEHFHFVFPQQWCQDDVSWYKTRDTFYQQKIVTLAVKRSSSPSNAGYPWFSSLFGGVAWPAMVTVAAAAVYNTGGEMFPTTDGAGTGIPRDLIMPAAALTTSQLAKMYLLAAHLNAIPVVGGGLSLAMDGVIIWVGGRAVDALVTADNDEKTPISKYENARYHGWDAHLVPVGEASLKH